MTPGKIIALTRWTFVGKVLSLLFNMLSRLVIAFLSFFSFFSFFYTHTHTHKYVCVCILLVLFLWEPWLIQLCQLSVKGRRMEPASLWKKHQRICSHLWPTTHNWNFPLWESEEWIYNSICQETPGMKISKSTESTLWLPWWDEALVSENVLALIAKIKNFKRTISSIRVLDDFHFDLWAVFPLVGSDREKRGSLVWNNLQCYLNSFISFYTAKLKPTFW